MKSLVRIVLALTLICVTVNAECQIKLDLKKKIENKVNQKINQKADKAIDKSMDAVEGGIKGDTKKGDQAAQPAADQNKQGTKQTGTEGQNNVENTSASQPGLEAYSKYDFVPGEKVIFFEDFSQDAVGDFPALWNTNGSAEVVTTNLLPGKWMKYASDNGTIWTDELLKLPENYTIEFDVVPVAGEQKSMAGWSVRLMQAKNPKAWDSGSAPGEGGFKFTVEYFGRPGYNTWLNKADCQAAQLNGYKEGDEFKEKMDQKYHIAIWVQKTRVRIYQDQNKIFDVPKAFPTGCVKPDRLRFDYGAAMISNVRIAVGAPDMRSKLITEGRLISYGIYFDVNKDVVKPESYGTLKEIANVLTENPDVKVKIVGHTDSDGADAANLDLSKRRGASVKNELVKTFSIDAARLESDGLGETQPVAQNDTPANKALNRRVEFIKL